MSQRTDPMYYEFDVQDLKSRNTHRARMFCWWSGDVSIAGLRGMCDCQLGGFFLAASKNMFPTWEQFRHGTESGNANNAFTYAQNDWRRQNKCDCSKPSHRYVAVQAITPDGAVIDINGAHKAA